MTNKSQHVNVTKSCTIGRDPSKSCDVRKQPFAEIFVEEIKKDPTSRTFLPTSMCSERGNGGRRGRSDLTEFANSEIILRDFTTELVLNSRLTRQLWISD